MTDLAARSSPPTPSLALGTIVAGRYQLDELLAIGGMGEVYAALQLPLGRRVALKILRPGRRNVSRSSARFAREAALMSRLYHPNTVSILDHGELHDGRPYIAMEYVDGEPLSHLLDRDGAMAPTVAVQVATQVASALEEAHGCGIIHRDVKADNVLVGWLEPGEAPFVKVLDFGIARGHDASERLTAPGCVCGTTEYMSPEQARGDAIDHRADVYALGVMLWEMLAGHLPYRAQTPLHVALAHQQAPVPPLPATVPEPIARCAYRAMAKEPEDRYATAEDLRQALLAAVSDQGGKVGRAAIWVAAAAVAVVLVMGVVGVLV